MYRTLRLHFPELFDWMRKVDDCRKKASNYELPAHLTACLAMFLFKAGSRNQYNQYREDRQFQKTYFHSVLEARLVTPNGFSISIATEWIENPEGGEYDKQDCERNPSS
jgi:hypothetical protein